MSRFLPNLSAAALRFPIPVSIAVLLCIYGNLDVADMIRDGMTADNHIYLGGAAAFMAAVAAHYFAQGRGLPRLTELLLALVVAIAAGALAFWDVYLRSSHLFLFAGLLPILMIAGFLRRDARQGALWLFSLRLGLTVLAATVAGLIFTGGLTAVVAGFIALFDVPPPWNAYEHVWMSAATLVGPLYGLALLPTRIDEEGGPADGRYSHLERGVSVLVAYVMVPVAIAYILILHIYAAKIIIDGELPKGQIALMVSIFAVGGTATWLIAWPWRETGTTVLRFFVRSWFWFTIVPLILLVIAIYVRISAYGVTFERYSGALIALWLALTAAYLAIRRQHADMRVLLGSFAILALLGSTGPWGANSLSIESQFGRLAGYFQRDKLLTSGGKVVDTPPSLSDESYLEIASVLDALKELDGLDKLKSYFAGRPDDPFTAGAPDWNTLVRIKRVLKLDRFVPALDEVNFSANLPLAQEIEEKARIIGPFEVSSQQEPVPAEMFGKIERGDLVVTAGERKWSIAVKPLLLQLKESTARIEMDPFRYKQQPIVYDLEPGVKLVFTFAQGTIGDQQTHMRVIFWLILRQ